MSFLTPLPSFPHSSRNPPPSYPRAIRSPPALLIPFQSQPSPLLPRAICSPPAFLIPFQSQPSDPLVGLPTACLRPPCSPTPPVGPKATKGNQNGVVKVSAQLNEVVQGKSSNSAPPSENSSKNSETTVPDAASISAFMNQVAGLVKLVDSRDIMELQLKQDNFEVLIRKKEALAPPPAPPMVMMQSSQPQAMLHSQPPPPQAALTPSAPSPSAPAPAPAPAPTKPKSSHPPLKCPMAGTLYRAPAPGAPPFVKVGDKVQKGQVVCIIEAMKLMNEIEADQSGTIVDIIAEDGKPVSLDMPLLVIEP